MVSGECTENRRILPKYIVRCRVIVVHGAVWHAKLANHNNDTIRAADVDELVDFLVFLTVCSASARHLNAMKSIGIGAKSVVRKFA